MPTILAPYWSKIVRHLLLALVAYFGAHAKDYSLNDITVFIATAFVFMATTAWSAIFKTTMDSPTKEIVLKLAASGSRHLVAFLAALLASAGYQGPWTSVSIIVFAANYLASHISHPNPSKAPAACPSLKDIKLMVAFLPLAFLATSCGSTNSSSASPLLPLPSIPALPNLYPSATAPKSVTSTAPATTSTGPEATTSTPASTTTITGREFAFKIGFVY